MELRHAIDMLAPAALDDLGPMVWADLGCGDGTFTRALAHGLAPGSTIHAIDRRPAIAPIDGNSAHVGINVHRGDFTRFPWPFDHLDGVLMANSLHYVRDHAAFLRQGARQMRPIHRFLIVEYDLVKGNRWVPYPLGRVALTDLFRALGYRSISMLGSRPSVYHRGDLYAALVA